MLSSYLWYRRWKGGWWYHVWKPYRAHGGRLVWLQRDADRSKGEWTNQFENHPTVPKLNAPK